MTNPNDPPNSLLEEPIGGLTKREYFAILAMQGMLANPLYAEKGCKVNDQIIPLDEASVKMADFLLNALSR